LALSEVLSGMKSEKQATRQYRLAKEKALFSVGKID
jgi:hypothetical protein